MAAEIEALVAVVQKLIQVIEERGAEQLTVSFAEAGRRLGRSAKTISRMEKRGEIESVLISGSMMIPVEELRRIATPKPVPTQRPRGKPSRKRVGSEDLTEAEFDAALKKR